ncbi:hypothetical protein C2845_PMPSC055979 [Panicum miliaceum]|uniref:Uncharacterized protein n=1 Tax=Panicum miliaceum TaxID=4540 RepID=A0A3L6PAM0_PANMI|nr:hypothetical protein C2845_PMPSC055979 [Panicum miliaceum]
MIDENYLVYGHTLKHAPDGSLVFFFPGYVNEISLPNPRFHLYKCQSLTFVLQPQEVARRSSVSGRMAQSRSRNAATDAPPPPYSYHGYAGGHAPAGSSSGYTPGWEQSAQQQQAGGRGWQSASSAEWDHPSRTNWQQSDATSSGVTPPLFAAHRSFSARGYNELG